jgi:hypothetical protein
VGTFKIEIEAVGGHGCQREIKSGAEVPGCGHEACPDCAARRFVMELKRKGNSLVSAKLTHWPGDPSSVQDDLLSGIRRGSF